MSRGCRSTTVYHALAFKPHKVDPVMARLWETLRVLRRNMDWWSELAYYINTDVLPLGPISFCAYILKQMGFIPDENWMLRDRYGVISLQRPEGDQKSAAWAHEWRVKMRNHLIGRHNGHRSDLTGCQDVDSNYAKHYLMHLEGNDQLLMEQILAGGLATNERKARWTKAEPQPCKFCRCGPDTAEHRWWKCAKWDHLRRHAPEHQPQWPACFRFCGLPTVDMHLAPSEIATTHAMMLNIQKHINAQEKASDCGRGPGPPFPKRPRFTVGHCRNGTVLGSGALGFGGVRTGDASVGDCDSCASDVLGNQQSKSTFSHSSAQRGAGLTGPKAATLPRAIELPPNIVMATRTVAGFGTRHVIRCTTCNSVGQLTNRTRFAREHTDCKRKRGRPRKLCADEKRHFAATMRGPLQLETGEGSQAACECSMSGQTALAALCCLGSAQDSPRGSAGGATLM